MMGLRNLIHASDKPETADREIALWFSADEIHPFERDLDRWVNEMPTDQ
jgi:nucleoside-diphosphate kinase